ncbi:ATP-dependent DNA helicase RecQ [Pirellula sp. SH-Sr6A]|uniref:RecQ family ATP-dependent DNA helicase n=1 Tax=Pirellula sp. SH-Sr6A TaxID=1632865 RepID=UPI00078B75CC|nr:RecQ family ATP-dependent DNA helicase [Pirellula sp. SH-Sr6A]AMV31465.1 ATP-dependent DNA helicase RecQ [Pirellula sp. SH-Sr6A]
MSNTVNLDLQEALHQFGMAEFRRGQREVIDHVIAGNDCLCVMPTGGGKSLCYQLPSLVRTGLTIVVSPLIALMKDQVDGLTKRGITATLINSTLSPSEQAYRLERVAGGHYRLLYVAPERLRNPTFLDAIRSTPVQLLAIDEAHCISEWGHDFRPDYQRVGKFREFLGGVQTIALTATATPRVRQDIVASLKLKVAKHFVTGFARDNLFLGVVTVHSDREKDKKLLEFLETSPGSGIIYAATRKRCESLVELLAKERKMSVGAYHAGLAPEQRKLVQDQFMRGELEAIVATNAFGMGIDKSDLRYVVHYNMPGTLEAYYQEAGRAGRDGHSSQCVLLYSAQDRYIQEFFIENANPSREVLQSVYEFLLQREEDPIELTAEQIKELMNAPTTSEAVNSALQILARTDVLERLEVAGGLAMVRIQSQLPTLVDLLPRDATVKRSVLRAIEKAVGDRRDEAVYINPRWLMNQLQMERDTLSRHLRDLCSLPGFEYVPPFRGRAIHFRKRDVPFDQLRIDHASLDARKKSDYEKLDQMVAFAQCRSCRQKAILQYFGDMSAANCNICDRCQGKAGWPKIPVDRLAPKPVKPSEPVKHLDIAAATTNGISSKETAASLGPADRGDGGVDKKVPKPRAEKVSKKAKVSAGEVVPSPTEQEDARELLRKLVGAIERTHGYLSKTILAQFFSGIDNRAIQGLRLQRLPEFGLLANWKKSHVSSFLDLLLDKSVLLLTELRAGKVTVSVSPSGLEMLHGIGVWPDEIVHPCARYQSQSAVSLAKPMPAEIDATEIDAADLAENGCANESIQDVMPLHPSDSVDSIVTKPVEVVSPQVPAGSDKVALPDCELRDALQVRDPMIGTFQDWQWSVRLAKHGYRLGEIALIRGKQPDQILGDLCDALDVGERIPIEQLFDKRTQIAIREVDGRAVVPPLAFASFPRLWEFAKRWKTE